VAVETLKRIFLGRALPSFKAEHQLLPKFLALPVFSSDPLSSNAYATEEMMLVLALAGATAFRYMLPIALAIALLLIVVITSYRQTVRAYPQGGGSYIVSRENLGTLPGLVAAGAILTDYVLTVSVSVTAGTIAVTSAAPSLAEHRVGIALGFLALVTLANLRGVKEAGQLFAIPTYGFVLMVLVTLLTGFVRCLGGCPQAAPAGFELEATASVSLFLLLRAFASGATALTGVEAIADGVQAFRRPQSRNAASTLAIMGAMSVSMFLGITFLARKVHVRVGEGLSEHKSVLAQIGETVFGGGLPFFLLQGFTAGILILAANTAYQDFPRLSAILARDRFMPSQFRNRGDRLVFSNGVVVLAFLAGSLIWAFEANLTRLIQLYVVGVFTAFTLSQSGMVRRWYRRRGEGWQRSMAINAVGAVTTGVVLVIVAATKFTHGAWIVMVAIPLIVLLFLGIHRHYQTVGAALRRGIRPIPGAPGNTFVLLVPDVGLATTDAIGYLRALRPERVIPLYVGDAARFDGAAAAWSRAAPRMGELRRLVVDTSVGRALRPFLRQLPRSPEDFVTVVVPETISGRGMLAYIRSRASLFLKASLLFEPGVVVTDVPLLAEERQHAALHADRPLEPERTVVLVPVATVDNASIRAVSYAKSLRPTQIEALNFATDPNDMALLLRDWGESGMDIPVSVVEAPFRDLGEPMLREIRRHTARGDTIVTVVLPEVVVRRWWQHVLHRQTALFFKRLLLFEPGVVVTSVPYLL
jgi:amino acid transporter